MRQLLHISDIHFGPPHVNEVSDGVLDLITRRQPDHVIISGDLTQRAKPHQFQQARAFVDRMPVPSLTVPGNHDVPLYRVWERGFAPYAAYRRYFSPELEPEFEDEEMLIIGLNSAHGLTVKDGRLTRATLRRAARRLAQAPSSVYKLIVVHHQLVPPPRYDNLRVLENAHEALDLFSRHGVDMVLSGHLHQAYITTSEAYQPSGRRPVLLVHSGTSTSNRGRGSERLKNTCNWIRLEDGEIEISQLEWRPQGPGFEQAGFVETSRHRYPRNNQPAFALSRF